MHASANHSDSIRIQNGKTIERRIVLTILLSETTVWHRHETEHRLGAGSMQETQISMSSNDSNDFKPMY